MRTDIVEIDLADIKNMETFDRRSIPREDTCTSRIDRDVFSEDARGSSWPPSHNGIVGSRIYATRYAGQIQEVR